MADDQYYYGEGGDDQYNAEGGICKVYDKEDGFTSLVQCLLAVIALGSLYVKRHHEIPKRKFMTWWLDVSKQGIGAVYAHVANMFIASIMSSFTRGDYVLEDQCAWYSISFITDTTVGLFFSLVFLGILNSEAKKRNWDSLMNTGVYEGPDGMVHWRNQLISWVIILTLVKFPVVFVMWAFSPILSRADHYLKAGPEHTSAHEPHDDAETGDYVATDDNGDVQRQAPDSQSFELPEVRLGSVRTLV
eukprot:scaffold2713_cov253-Chaetoceros_neogracile.AAC.2